MFDWTMKHFYSAPGHDDLNWDATPEAFGIITMSDTTARKNALKTFNKIEYMRVRDLDIVAFVTASSKGRDEPYMVAIDFLGHACSCECPSFAHRESPCKHVVAVVAKAVERMEGRADTSATAWMELALAEARNAALQKMPWETKPSFDPHMAQEYGYAIAKVTIARREVEGYMLENRRLWTGPLPLPVPGERIQVHLPTGDRVKATVIEEDLEHRIFQGYLVELDETPENFESNIMVIAGAEMERTEELIEESKRHHRQSIAAEQGVSLN
jgi:hypothetical protein